MVPVNLQPPRLVSLGPLLIAGIGRRFASNDFAGIPALWQELQPHFGQIPGQKGKTAYGLVASMAIAAESYFISPGSKYRIFPISTAILRPSGFPPSAGLYFCTKDTSPR